MNIPTISEDIDFLNELAESADESADGMPLGEGREQIQEAARRLRTLADRLTTLRSLTSLAGIASALAKANAKCDDPACEFCNSTTQEPA